MSQRFREPVARTFINNDKQSLNSNSMTNKVFLLIINDADHT